MKKSFATFLMLSVLVACDRKELAVDTADHPNPVAARGTRDNFIPLVVVAYQNTYYGGSRRYYYQDDGDFRNSLANDMFSSIKVYKGPNFDDYVRTYGKEPTVSFCSNINEGTPCDAFKVGLYPTLSHNDYYSSIVFNRDFLPYENPYYVNPVDQPSETFPVHTIVKLYSNINFGVDYINILGTTNAEHRDLGDYRILGKNDYYSSGVASKGPNWAPNTGVWFFRDLNGSGGAKFFGCDGVTCTNVSDFRNIGMNDAITSHRSTYN